MEKHNKEFLYRIEFILGSRDKHPWGKAIGLKNARVQSIFKGQIPTAPALEIIHRAENVNLNWLLTGEGPHFVVESWVDDEHVATMFTEWRGLQEAKAALYLLTDGEGRATVVTTVPTVHIYSDGVVSNYTEVRVFPYLGQKSMAAAAACSGLRLVSMDALTFRAVSGGWKGPVHLLGDLLTDYTVPTAEGIRDAVGRYDLRPQEEEKLLAHYRHLQGSERDAVMTVVETMDKVVEVMQRPPGVVQNPDLETESDSGGVSGQPAAADQVHPDN